ncbi:hypothetical protein DFS33DRAFT_780179 [Desarmillaria ectypa]|nr:hypothetical protein DFS33DRAFT_780179 [Desarmillaria ectypa]
MYYTQRRRPLSRPFRLGATKKQTGARAMTVKTNIPTGPFLAIIIAMLCAGILPGKSPPDLLSAVMPNEDEEGGESDSDAREEDGQSAISTGFFLCKSESMPYSKDSSTRPLLHRQSFMRLCRRVPHIPSVNVDMVILVDGIRAHLSGWSSVWSYIFGVGTCTLARIDIRDVAIMHGTGNVSFCSDLHVVCLHA